MSPATESKAITYHTDSGAEVKLSANIIRNYLVQGRGHVSDQEVMMFLMLCKNQRLDPFLREAYLIKYGSDSPATIVTGKEVFTKRAERDPEFRGVKAGIIVLTEDGAVIEREGSFYLKDREQLVGGWAEVYKQNREVPYKSTVEFDEYAGKKKDGSLNSQWSSKPATMIRKVAFVQALREAFPGSFSGLYDQAEVSQVIGDVELSDAPVHAERDVTPVAEGDGGETGPTAEQQKQEVREKIVSSPTDDDGGPVNEPAAPEKRSPFGEPTVINAGAPVKVGKSEKGKEAIGESVQRMKTAAGQKELDDDDPEYPVV